MIPRSAIPVLLLAALIHLLGAMACAEETTLEEGLADIASSISTTLADGQIRKIAVVDFLDLNGYRSTLGPFIGEELITQLFAVRPGLFDVVERRQLVKVLNEQKLTESALFDPSTIADVGRILGLEAIVTGSIADTGSSIKINARVVSVESGRVFAAAAAKVIKDDTVQALLRQTAGPSASDSGTQSRSGVPTSQPSDAFFQNRFLRATVSSVGTSLEGKVRTLGNDDTGKRRFRITVALLVENLTEEEVLLAAGISYQRCSVNLITDSGLSLRADRREVSGLPCLYDEDDERDYSSIGSRGRTTVVLAFTGDSAQLGATASLGAELFRFQNGRPRKFTLGISGIRLPSVGE